MLMKPPKGTMLSRGDPLARGLVGCWLMNEGGGNIVNDLSGNYYTANFNSNTAWVAAKYGNGTYYNGTDDAVNGNYPDWRSADHAGTVVMWINPSALTGFHTIFSTSDEGTTTSYIAIRVSSAGVLQLVQQNAADTLTLVYEDTYLIPVNTWTQIVVVSDGSQYKFYINSLLQATKTSAGSNNGDWFADTTLRDNFCFSSTHVTSYSGEFFGTIDHVLIYNRSLSASEIAQLYREPFGMFEREPIELWTATMGGGAAPSNMIYDYRVRVG